MAKYENTYLLADRIAYKCTCMALFHFNFSTLLKLLKKSHIVGSNYISVKPE